MHRTLALLRECDVRPSKFDAFRCRDGCSSHKYVDGYYSRLALRKRRENFRGADISTRLLRPSVAERNAILLKAKRTILLLWCVTCARSSKDDREDGSEKRKTWSRAILRNQDPISGANSISHREPRWIEIFDSAQHF